MIRLGDLHEILQIRLRRKNRRKNDLMLFLMRNACYLVSSPDFKGQQKQHQGKRKPKYLFGIQCRVGLSPTTIQILKHHHYKPDFYYIYA